MTGGAMYPKRLVEVDLPIKRISAHARREKSIRHGHISTLHIWWARRPLAACRAVLCAALWPDPADKHCPQSFRETAARLMNKFAFTAAEQRSVADLCHSYTWGKLSALRQPDGQLDPTNADHLNFLRYLLLDFIADFSNWDASTQPHYLETARALTQAAHEALGGLPGTRPLVVDPFAGGGAIPLEALRVGADAFASDLNPVAVLLNKVVLEYIPKYGQRLADEVRKWGEWVKEEAEKELAEFYPKDPDGATPIAYLWARTITCEGPGCGFEVPMINQMWIKKRGAPTYAFEFSVDQTRHLIDIQIIENPSPESVASGTTRKGSVTCPGCGYTTPARRVRLQGCEGRMGGRLMGVVLAIRGTTKRRFRSPTGQDLAAIQEASDKFGHIEKSALFPQYLEVSIPLTELRRISVPLYGLDSFDRLFLTRQKLALSVLELIIKRAAQRLSGSCEDPVLRTAVLDIISLGVSNILHYNMNLSTYLSNGMVSAFIQGTSLAMRSDFAEANPLMPRLVGGLDYSLKQICLLLERMSDSWPGSGATELYSATDLGLPDDSMTLAVTDPPYYDSIPYAHLADVFYIWLKACRQDTYTTMFRSALVEKAAEIVEDRAHSRSPSRKRADFFESELSKAFLEIRRIVAKDQVMVVVFAHKSTRGWEAMLNGLLAANWTVTSSWPIDTERPARMNAYQNASLLSSVHVVCRPVDVDKVGEWRSVLDELPHRIHEWMPRLAQEGVVGADAIFACLGPALEIYSRYSRVERADGTAVPLGDVMGENSQVVERGYLSYVWEAVSKEALSMIFEEADTAGFEADARLTAMWLWTLSTAPDDVEASANDKVIKSTGYTLEYDAARKIAQGLGAHLEQLGTMVEIRGDKARLLPVAERSKALFGKEGPSVPRKRKPEAQLSFFDEVGVTEEGGSVHELGAAPHGATVLDRVHQAMLLFAAGRSEALRRLLVEEGVGQEARFWRLAQALSALYPPQTDEKRWVDGVLARKKGLGF